MRLRRPRFTWHRWFAWRPVRLTGTSDWVWLEWIERWYSPSAYVKRQYRESSK